jgi:basic amino acid/polyamine antiporter, APA family
MPVHATQSVEPAAAPRRQLTLLDSTSIIVGIVIGSTIYESTPLIAQQVPDLAWLIGIWVLGGLLSLVGALCYAELANAYPTEGGDYTYLTRAFGRKLGFVFAWVQFWIVRPGSIGSIAYVFARYANQLYPLGEGPQPLIFYAVTAIGVLSGINLLGVRQGKGTQNILTIAKLTGLAAVVLAGFFFHAPLATPAATLLSAPPPELSKLAFAMIFIFYAYGGWNEMAYVGSEVQDPAKNILRALVLGTVAVGALYILLQLAFVRALGLDGLRNTEAVAADVLRLRLGTWGVRLVSVLICVSALGAINGMIFTGARIYYAMGKDNELFGWLGEWSSSLDTPIRPLVIQGLVTVALAIGFGFREKGAARSGFENSVIFTTPLFWGFLVLVGLSLFVLRYREAEVPRPFRVPLYPLLPLVFCASSGFMFWKSLDYAWLMQRYWVLGSLGVVALGLALSFLNRRRSDQ